MAKKKQDTSRNNHVQNLHTKASKVKSKKKDTEERFRTFGNHGSSYIALVFVLGKLDALSFVW
jgi:hypothetical protein